MKPYFLSFLFFISLFPLESKAEEEPSELSLYSVNTGSFLYHLVPYDPDSHQYFGNQYFSVERKFSADSDYSFMLGTFLNSQANRCMLIGVRKDWYRVNSKLVIKGMYSYAGEFFIDAFEDCGDGGIYKTSKEKVGVAFAPYIYHAAQYNFTDYFGVEAGFILPGIIVMSMQWSF
ncbi:MULTISPECIES: hypothetical protein [Aliivibrio]|uniref:Acyloxyacyl hydrolase n=1 Tax=Aliivibrio finisterrensis TaxID=511998 RepID=A0A4Q5KKY5_9GAMM|nr:MULTISPECIES: hypothetical protein [Aliivibrio]MDD9173674.1 hypothetical protein [Aliivibrio sp. S3TY1]MDD9178847.1 hypothetical protein [Aliivibrio sp. A6]MDD9190750.1 hypothetical protein [Aliivibrio sp. S2TY2]RYU46982.1 hypothetical protein ERW49_07555 [Aliivibrio finisterrensis]RYU50165.1 hypothetical protein ERW57_13100 [Aliivibrio finisterrensis]